MRNISSRPLVGTLPGSPSTSTRSDDARNSTRRLDWRILRRLCRVTSWTSARFSRRTPSTARTPSRQPATHPTLLLCTRRFSRFSNLELSSRRTNGCALLKYDKNNKIHVDVVDGIAEGNALPEVRTIEECIAAAKEAGFEVQYTFDRATTGGVPWQAAMKSARRAAYLTHILTGVLEFIRFAPKGTQAVHTMLLKAAVNLEKGGDLGIFSPMYLIVMRKPTA